MPPKRRRSNKEEEEEGGGDDNDVAGSHPSAQKRSTGSRSAARKRNEARTNDHALYASTRAATTAAATTTTTSEPGTGTVTGVQSKVRAKAKAKVKAKAGAVAKVTTKNEQEDSHSDDGDDDDDGGRSYWLMKAEPESRYEKGRDLKFSVDDLAACEEPAAWDGVRNYGARNNLKAMKKGDLAFFYHSNCKQPGIVGIMEIVREASVDETAFDPDEPYYDAKSDRDDPKWFLVHVVLQRKLDRPIGLPELKSYANGELSEMPLLKQGRLSVSAVPRKCWDFILKLEKEQT